MAGHKPRDSFYSSPSPVLGDITCQEAATSRPGTLLACIDLGTSAGRLFLYEADAARELLRAAFGAWRILDPDGPLDALIGDLLGDQDDQADEHVPPGFIHPGQVAPYGDNTPEVEPPPLGTPERAAWAAQAAVHAEPVAAEDDAPLTGCVRCAATGVPLRPLTLEPGLVCWNSDACAERQAVRATQCRTPALHAAGRCACVGINWTDTAAAEVAQAERVQVAGDVL